MEGEGCSWVTHLHVNTWLHTLWHIFAPVHSHTAHVSLHTICPARFGGSMIAWGPHIQRMQCGCSHMCYYMWRCFLEPINMLLIDSLTDKSLWLPAAAAPRTYWSLMHMCTQHYIQEQTDAHKHMTPDQRPLHLCFVLISIFLISYLPTMWMNFSMQIGWWTSESESSQQKGIILIL